MDEHRPSKHWVYIATGSNQKYIFASNRLRHILGASQLIYESCRTWVLQAVRALGMDPDSTVVMTASGKAMLLVDSTEAGQEVITTVTRKALHDAPGLRITGAISDPFDPQDAHAYQETFTTVRKQCAQARSARPDLSLRDRVMPWHRLCRDTGLPAEREELYGDAEPVWASAGVLARSRVRKAAADRLGKPFGEHTHLLPKHLDTLKDDGWMAVIHADGNGIGGLFRHFDQHIAAIEGIDPVPLDKYVEWQRDIAEQLDLATELAVSDAIKALVGEFRTDQVEHRLLPLVLGGDDVTVICAAELAIPFVREFATAFELQTAQQPKLTRLASEATGRPYLTASAGIAIVKQHHPLANAYELAEDLVKSAKQCKTELGSVAAFDFHIVNDSTRHELSSLREYLVGPGDELISRHAGPYALGEIDDLPEELQHRSVGRLRTIMDWLEYSTWLSKTQAHALRDAADRSLDEYLHLLGRVVGRAGLETGLEAGLERGDVESMLSIQDGEGRYLRLFDALALHGLRHSAPGSGPVLSGITTSEAGAK